MELTIEDIRTLQLAVDNMADDGMTDEGVKKLLVLHAKLEVMATRLTKRALDLPICPRCQIKKQILYRCQHCQSLESASQ